MTWTNKMVESESHEHDFPRITGEKVTPGSTWRCGCGRNFKVVDRRPSPTVNEVYSLAWEEVVRPEPNLPNPMRLSVRQRPKRKKTFRSWVRPR